MAKKYVYQFREGSGKDRNLLGGKGANLAEMTKLGMPVPQGFTISTEACTQYYEDGRKINDAIQAEIALNQIITQVNTAKVNVKSALSLFNKFINDPQQKLYDSSDNIFAEKNNFFS